MVFLSYVTSFISMILGLCEPFRKSIKTVLLFNFLGNLLVGMSYLFISKTGGAIICFVACVQVLINYLFTSKSKKIPIWLIVLNAIVFITANLLTFSAWYDLIALTSALIFVLSVAQSKAQYYRVFFIINSFLWIFYDVLASAYGNLFTHTALFVATFIAIRSRDKKNKNI